MFYKSHILIKVHNPSIHGFPANKVDPDISGRVKSTKTGFDPGIFCRFIFLINHQDMEEVMI